MSFKEYLAEQQEINESTKFVVNFEDSMGNVKPIQVGDGGKILSIRNPNNSNAAKSSLAYKITPKDFKEAGYPNSGIKDQENWVVDAGKEAWKKSKGDAKKFAIEFGKLMKLPGSFTADLG